MNREFNTEERPELVFPTPAHVTETEERQRGQILVQLLGLKEHKSPHGDIFSEPRYWLGTEYQDKTALGVFRVVKRIVEGEK